MVGKGVDCAMNITVNEMAPSGLDEYARVPIAFRVESEFLIEPLSEGLGGLRLVERAVGHPYVKDCDAYGNSGPLSWPRRFDISNWGFFIGYRASQPVGGAAVAFNTPGVHMLGGRKDLAVLWDLRVKPDMRRSGVGTRLFTHAAEWAREHGCKQLKIETQNVNVPACRFYAKQGCDLGEINRYAYIGCPEVAHEVMLIWYMDL